MSTNLPELQRQRHEVCAGRRRGAAPSPRAAGRGRQAHRPGGAFLRRHGRFTSVV